MVPFGMQLSWKTTAAAVLAALGAGLVGASHAWALFDPTNQGVHVLAIVGAGAIAAGVQMLGLAARDNNKTSEQVGAGPKETK